MRSKIHYRVFLPSLLSHYLSNIDLGYSACKERPFGLSCWYASIGESHTAHINRPSPISKLCGQTQGRQSPPGEVPPNRKGEGKKTNILEDSFSRGQERSQWLEPSKLRSPMHSAVGADRARAGRFSGPTLGRGRGWWRAEASYEITWVPLVAPPLHPKGQGPLACGGVVVTSCHAEHFYSQRVSAPDR